MKKFNKGMEFTLFINRSSRFEEFLASTRRFMACAAAACSFLWNKFPSKNVFILHIAIMMMMIMWHHISTNPTKWECAIKVMSGDL